MSKQYLTRLTPNANGWQGPSGREGKCYWTEENPLFEGIHHFGWEEWLFECTEEKDGFCYGFLQCFNKAGRTSRIIPSLHLYTRKCQSLAPKAAASYLYVGRINDLEVLGPEHRDIVNEITNIRRDAMIVSIQAQQIENASNLFDAQNVANGILNVRFKKDHVYLPSGPLEQRVIQSFPHLLYKFMLYDISERQEFLWEVNRL